MKPSDWNFCLVDGTIFEEDNGLVIIPLLPIEYWKEHECLGAGNEFSDVIDWDLFPVGYANYVGTEHEMLCSSKPLDEIRKDLTTLGFVEDENIAQFLIDCYE